MLNVIFYLFPLKNILINEYYTIQENLLFKTMRNDSYSSMIESSKSGQFLKQSHPRSMTPNDGSQMTQKSYNPYPLYKQKIRALLKPPDYSRQPPIFMSVREPRSEFEKKEASTQVKLLKKTFNTMYQRFNSYDNDLIMLKSEAIRVNALRSVGENDIENLQYKIDNLQHEENIMLNNIREETNNNIMYKHVRERMRQTLMYLEVKNQYLQDQIRLRDFLIEREHRKKIQTLENKFTSVQTFRQLQKTVYLDLKDRSQDIFVLKEDITTREKIHEMRKTRIKKYEEIAETAANEERDLKNNTMRECVLINILWAKQLDHRLAYEKKKYSSLEEAFQRIHAATLINNVQEILCKFLMKEDRLIDLMNTLNKNKEKCLAYLRKNDSIEEKIDEVLLSQKNDMDVNIIKLKQHIHGIIQKIRFAKEKQKKIKLVFDELKEWGIKKLSSVSGKDNKYETMELKAVYMALCKSIRGKITNPKTYSFITEV